MTPVFESIVIPTSDKIKHVYRVSKQVSDLG